MNGETPSVPITTLAGVASLTDLLPQLPLPTPLPQTVQNKSLLYNPSITQGAHHVLGISDDGLAAQLAHALRQTNTNQIELKDNLSTSDIEGEIPGLLQAVFRNDPQIFQGTACPEGINPMGPQQSYMHQDTPRGTVPGVSPHHGSPHAYNQQRNSPRYNQSQSPRYQNNVYASPSNSPFPATSAGFGQSPGPLSHQPNAVASPAQATAAERVMPHQYPSQASPSFSHSEALSKHPRRLRNPPPPPPPLVTNNGTEQFQQPVKSQSYIQDNTRNKSQHSGSKGNTEPVIMLNDIRNELNTSVRRLPLPPHLNSSEPSTNSDSSGHREKGADSHKKNEPVVVLEMLDPTMLKTINKGGSAIESHEEAFVGFQEVFKKYKEKREAHPHVVKTDCDSNDSRKRKREESFYNISRAAPGDMQFQVSRNRRNEDTYKNRAAKKRKHSVESDASSVSEFVEVEEEERVQHAKMKKEKQSKKRLLQPVVSLEDLLDSPMFKKFNSCADLILDAAEDTNFASMDKDDEDVECPPESLISRAVLNDLSGESAKLKTMNALSQIPPDRLVKLLTILLWNVRDGCRVTPNINQEEDEDESRLWRELTMDRVMRSMDASLTAMSIMTGKQMPKQVYLEDVIEKVIVYAKFQLHNTIYPEFDPVYKIDPKAKDGYHGSLKAKRARAGSVKHKSTITLYNKMCDLVGSLASLLEIQEMTDTIILQVSSLGVSTFFVENISELQLTAMKLVTTVFARYSKHRQLILEDIFASLARLPSSKRNLRNYRLNSDESIQMVTALALQLIQCVVQLPNDSNKEDESDKNKKPKEKGVEEIANTRSDNDVLIITSYETAMRTGYNFLSVFLKKCTTKGEEDYRPLFENFVQDLLSTVNKPDWPASELLLSLLGRILVQQFSSKATDMSLRVASLEYLGIVAARLRKDAITSQLNQNVIDDIVQKVNENDDEETSTRSKKKEKNTPDTTERLQQAMLEYLSYNSQSESALFFARQFYIAQWFRDTTVEADKSLKAQHNTSGEDHDDEFNETKEETSTEALQNTEKRKGFLYSQIEASAKSQGSIRHAGAKLDYDSACLVARYLSSKRPFAQSFDIYLTQILKVLSETAVAVRTKAMKCLTAVVEADPGILARSDMRRGVHGRFLDQSTSVREAAIELVGKFILIQPDLIPNYYDMLSDRILDTGISVRKRVIRIFKDICIEHGDYEKIPEMCVKMIRRVNDEEGIKKLVNEVFQSMWFSPVSSRDKEKESEKLLQKVMNITEVVAAAKDTSYEFFEQLLENLLKKDEDGNYNKGAITACKQIVDCLVENVLRIEETGLDKSESKSSSNRIVGCLSTLYLFSKIKPDLMVQHTTTLQPYLDIKCNTQGDFMVLHYVARILELVIPLMDHPSETFLAQVEENMIKLILKNGMMVVQSCVSCLGAVVNDVSHNYELVKDCFKKFYGVLARLMVDHKANRECPTLKQRRPTLLRALFTVGLLCKHFDFDSKEMGETKVCVRETVFDVFKYFFTHEDEEVQLKALTAIGFFACRHYTFMLSPSLKELYSKLLTDEFASVKLRCQVLKNLQVYLTEEELQMSKSDAEWKKHSKQEDLKEMGDVQSGMASTVMQVYLKELMETVFHESSQVRMTALNVVTLVLRQGLVHPIQCIPYLISMSTDYEQAVRVKADQQLQEIEKKYPGFTHMKALQGMKSSYRLQKVFNKNNPMEPIRGLRYNDDNQPYALNAFLYSLLRANRSHRRGLLTSILNLFDDSARISLEEQLYIADNLAFYAYQAQDEPLFIIHQIDIIVSVAGSNLLQSFRENLLHKHSNGLQNGIDSDKSDNLPNGDVNTPLDDDEDNDNPESLLTKLPENVKPLADIINMSQGCILLLVLKQHLKEMYGLTEGKIHRYSPTEAAKVYEKPLNRKSLPMFEPQHTLQVVRSVYDQDNCSDEEKKQKLINEYLEFRDLMMSIDPSEDDLSGDEAPSGGRATPQPGSSSNKSPSHLSDAGEGGGGSAINQDSNHLPPDPSSTSGALQSSSNTPSSKSSRISQYSDHHHHHSDRKKKGHISTLKSHKLLSSGHKSTPVVKKKRKKRRRLDSDDGDDSDDDPDFVG